MPAMVAPPYGTKQPYRAKAEALASSDAVALALHRLSVESRPAASSALTLQPSAHNLTKLLRMLSRNHRLLFSVVTAVLLWRAARAALKRHGAASKMRPRYIPWRRYIPPLQYIPPQRYIPRPQHILRLPYIGREPCKILLLSVTIKVR